MFSRVVKFLSKIPPPHTAVRVALFVHSCSAFFVTRLLMQLQQMVPTPSFVSPSSCTVLLLWCLTYYSLNKWQYFRERKALTSFKNGSGFIFKGGPIYGRLQYIMITRCTFDPYTISCLAFNSASILCDA